MTTKELNISTTPQRVSSNHYQDRRSVSGCLIRETFQIQENIPHKESSFFERMKKRIGRECLSENWERKYYADRYTCCPPPLFIPLITLIELSIFVYYSIQEGTVSTNGPVPIDSVLIYRPDRRHEIWRFFSYTLLHAGTIHLAFNLLIQLLVGLPLEMVHGSTRVMIIYFSGVLAGSLGTSVFDSKSLLVGASGGVYALLAAHLANVVINFDHMELAILRIIGVLFISSADVGFAIYDRYSKHPSSDYNFDRHLHHDNQTASTISYVAHLAGALAGLTIGLVVLKNFEQKLHEQLIWWIALGVYTASVLFAIIYNVYS